MPISFTPLKNGLFWSWILWGALGAFAEGFSSSLQHGGMAGTVGVGAGYNPTDRASLSLYYGQSNDANLGTIEQVMGKLSYAPWLLNLSGRIKTYPVYFGLFGTYTTHRNFFLKVPDRFPARDWYDPNSFRGGTLIGSELIWIQKGSSGASIYLELVTLDQQLIAFFNNLNFFEVGDLFSAGFGIRWYY